MASTALVTVVSGATYYAYAERMFESAAEFFKPTSEVEFLTLAGRNGWPEATLYRHHIVLDNLPNTDYVFLIDADMEFQGHVWDEVLPKQQAGGSGLTATMHPGYVRMPSQLLPFENRPESRAFVVPESRFRYYCGGFVGGTRKGYETLATRIAAGIDLDERDGVVAVWHDESHLNRQLASNPPTTTLDPSYCYPDESAYYEQHVWQQKYDRLIVALDKTPVERGVRD